MHKCVFPVGWLDQDIKASENKNGNETVGEEEEGGWC